jgi:hypothetical protein
VEVDAVARPVPPPNAVDDPRRKVLLDRPVDAHEQRLLLDYRDLEPLLRQVERGLESRTT